MLRYKETAPKPARQAPAERAPKRTRKNTWELEGEGFRFWMCLVPNARRPPALRAFIARGEVPSWSVQYPMGRSASRRSASRYCASYVSKLPSLFPPGFDPTAVVLPSFPSPVLRLSAEDRLAAPVSAYLEAMGERRVKGGPWSCGCDGVAVMREKLYGNPCAKHRRALAGRDPDTGEVLW
jgi:hypothetical protein